MAGYSGDIPVTKAWDGLASRPEATLIDVRTTAEWTFVGVPDLEPIGKATAFVAWNEFPSGAAVDLEPEAGCRADRVLQHAGSSRQPSLLEVTV